MQQLETAVQQALQDDAVRSKFSARGFLELKLDHVQLRDFLQSESAKFRKVIDAAGVKVECPEPAQARL